MGFLSDLTDTDSRTRQMAPEWIRGELKQSMEDFYNMPAPMPYMDPGVAPMNPALFKASLQSYGSEPQGRAQAAAGWHNLAGGAGSSMGIQGLQQAAGGAPQFQYGQGVFDQTMANLMPGLQPAYDAATRDIGRNLQWNTLPGLDMQNAMLGGSTGHQGHSKLGQRSVLETGMAQDRAADVGTALYTNALNQGQNAAMAAGQQNLGANLTNQAQLISGGLDFARTGLDANQDFFNIAQGIDANRMNVGNMYQNYAQDVLNDQIRRYNMEQQIPYQQAQQKFLTLADVAKQFQRTENQQGQSYLDTIGQVAGIAGNVMGLPWPGGGGGGGAPTGTMYPTTGGGYGGYGPNPMDIYGGYSYQPQMYGGGYQPVTLQPRNWGNG